MKQRLSLITFVVVILAVLAVVWVLRARTHDHHVVATPSKVETHPTSVVSSVVSKVVTPAPVVVQPATVQKSATTNLPAAAVPKPNDPIAHFSDTSISFSQRHAELQALGKKGDAASIKTLMLVGDAQIYANRYAVEALGQCQGVEVRAYLAGKLNDSDALLAIAAIQALGQVAAGAAIPALDEALVENHTRQDGLQNMVCTAVVQTLGLTASPAAAPALIQELQRVKDSNWDLEYGSAVIRALRNMDSPDSGSAMLAYANALAARMPTEPMARSFYERKIAEARGVRTTP